VSKLGVPNDGDVRRPCRQRTYIVGVHTARAGLDPPLVPCASTRYIRPDVDCEEFGNVLVNPCSIERVALRTYGEGEDVGTVSSEGLELGASDRIPELDYPERVSRHDDAISGRMVIEHTGDRKPSMLLTKAPPQSKLRFDHLVCGPYSFDPIFDRIPRPIFEQHYLSIQRLAMY